jgi:MOSC domain-containing protein YiiM
MDEPANTPPVGRVHAIHVSDGGVPKHELPSARVAAHGLEGDRQEHTRFHGGPERAVCVFGLDIIQRVQAEGHPIQPGSTGENLTVAGLDWALVKVGSRLCFGGGVELEVVSFADPCKLIAASFVDDDFRRIDAELRPGESRAYTRVLTTGVLTRGESVTLR